MLETTHFRTSPRSRPGPRSLPRRSQDRDPRFLGDRVSLACSFQKEETVLLDMPSASSRRRASSPSTPTTSSETRALARGRAPLRHQDRDGRGAERRGADGDARRAAPGAPARLPRGRQGRAAGRALETSTAGSRRPPRPVADARGRAEARLGRRARAVEGEPARRLVDDDCWTYIREHEPPTTRCTTAATHPPATLTRRPGRRPRPLGWQRPHRVRTASSRCSGSSSSSHLDELEAEAIHIMRELAAELERPVLLWAARTRSSCSDSPRRRSGPASSRSRSCTLTRATTSPR